MNLPKFYPSVEIQKNVYRDWKRGINPYHRLTMPESRRAIQLMAPRRCLNLEQQNELIQLQKKMMGLQS